MRVVIRFLICSILLLLSSVAFGWEYYDEFKRGVYIAFDDGGTATAFAVLKGDKHFIVTNKHVFCNFTSTTNGKVKCLNKQWIKLVFNQNQITNTEVLLPGTIILKISLLNQDSTPRWRTISNEDIDIAVLPGPLVMEDKEKNPPNDNAGYNIKCIPYICLADDKILDAEKTQPGDELFIIGYPFGFRGGDRNVFPVFRRGILATDPRDRFLENQIFERAFLVDVLPFKGNSGSPVISPPGSRINRVKNIPYVIGVQSRKSPGNPGEESTNLTVVIPASVIKEIIDSF